MHIVGYEALQLFGSRLPLLDLPLSIWGILARSMTRELSRQGERDLPICLHLGYLGFEGRRARLWPPPNVRVGA